MDFSELAKKLSLELDEFLELLEIFIESGGSDLQDLSAAIDAQDTQQAIEASHSIKGSSGNLGFMEMYEAARGVEEAARHDSLAGALEAMKVLLKHLDLIERELNLAKEAG